jgi:hypothetical protein
MLIKPFEQVIYIEQDVKVDSFIPHMCMFKSQLDILLSQPHMRNNVIQQVGEVISTVERQHALRSLQGYQELLNCLYPYFLNARDAIYKHTGNVRIVRSWVNIMGKGAEGLSHAHKVPGLVGIFYLDAVVESGKFVVINDNVNLASERDIPLDKKYYIDVAPYTFICHDNTLVHAVSKHQAGKSRVSIIFEAMVE